MACIGIVDDEVYIRRIVEAYLQKAGFETHAMETAEEAIDLLKENIPDLWVIDIMLPGMDGFTLCRKIREVAENPVIMISARDSEVDKVLGLEIGCDDYLTKPFNPRELVARVKRHLAKWNSYQDRGKPVDSESVNVGPLAIDDGKREILWEGKSIQATNLEFLLVRFMVMRLGVALSREQILHHVWGEDYFGSDRAVDDLVKRVRQKLPELPLKTIWGYGYRLNAMTHEK
jgi:two-component system, OmpR family, response regulator CssR